MLDEYQRKILRQKFYFWGDRIGIRYGQGKVIVALAVALLFLSVFHLTDIHKPDYTNNDALMMAIQQRQDHLNHYHDSIITHRYQPTARIAEKMEMAAQQKDKKKEPAGPVHLNKATLKELQRLNGIGPVTAKRIIAMRKKLEGFTSAEELLDVKGIGPVTLGKLKPHIVIE